MARVEEEGGDVVTLGTIGAIFGREARIGPRSPFVLYALVLPVVLTAVVQGVFGSLFDPPPRLAIVDLGDSQISASAGELEGVDVTFLSDPELLRTRVESNDFDAGLILAPGFDAAVRAEERPILEFYVGGESLASDRIILGISTLDLVRELEGRVSPVSVEIVDLGAGAVDVSQRLLPMLVIMTLVIAGAFVPAAAVVQEREDRTLSALLVTPATIADVYSAKGLMAFVLAMMTGLMTLVLNDAFGTAPWLMIGIMSLAAAMMVEIGLIVGSLSRDSNTLLTVFKAGGILILFPVFSFLFPGVPEWIGRLGPTYYFLAPVFDVAVRGAALGDVAGDLAIAAVIVVALVPVVLMAGRRLEARIAAA